MNHKLGPEPFPNAGSMIDDHNYILSTVALNRHYWVISSGYAYGSLKVNADLIDRSWCSEIMN